MPDAGLQGAVEPILQSRLPFTPWSDPALARMPGTAPVEGAWIIVDEAYSPQLALRRAMIDDRPDAVIAALPGTDAMQAEALDLVRAHLPAGFTDDGDTLTCPDGARVTPDEPLPTIGRLLQEDLLLLRHDGREQVLVAGVLCFPASWTLAEKLGRPLTAIHDPVPPYDSALATRVQRLFDRLPPGRALWRANALGYADPALHQPRPEAAPRRDGPARYLRCERQTILRLPRSGAIAFAVHTYLVTPDALTPEQGASCPIPFAR